MDLYAHGEHTIWTDPYIRRQLLLAQLDPETDAASRRPQARAAIVDEKLAMVGLSDWADRYVHELSGGMQQRVGLARALANDAPILLMDEAFSALDPMIRTDMQSVLLDLQQELAKTIVFITHDLDEALRIGDRIALLRDGSVIQQGTGQDIVLSPADDYVANFVQHVDRGKVLRVGSVMEPLNGALPGAMVAADMTLSEALRDMMTRGIQSLGVQDARGQPVGQLSMQRAISVSAGA